MVDDDYIRKIPFAEIDLGDSFFDSLRASYFGFNNWFMGKAANGEYGYFAFNCNDSLIAMLFLKEEEGPEEGVKPLMDFPRMKIGTFKVDFKHHTGLGKRLLAIALREFAKSHLGYVYVTMHENDRTSGLANLLNRYGFDYWGDKGSEIVLFKRAALLDADVFASYPFVSKENGNCWILSILPEYHKRLFGDVHLTSEFGQPVIDERCLNSIEKIYLSRAYNAHDLMPGDKVVIYRTSDIPGRAYYRSVVTSVCTVVKVIDINHYRNEDEFLKRVKGKTVFTLQELRDFWASKRFPWLICLLFNFPLERYPNRKMLLDSGLIDRGHLVCEPISGQRMDGILRLGNADEGFIID